jgi:hypothetical protein
MDVYQLLSSILASEAIQPMIVFGSNTSFQQGAHHFQSAPETRQGRSPLALRKCDRPRVTARLPFTAGAPYFGGCKSP